ncbi:TetR/AcrR family transcriptional regulator C-terminal domain-containing protein [Paenibacillus sp. MWE-103]|uniref:TetR/AcrR family transcriptional regulator C-terminal domain-containing protein n=1 Tax=Paenibacillus artemisiicola TaxID=1172618 RepID=A0ABS3W5C6_9BACL|nr:TetR/AcrR family transcriptional regulator C-terminal domain-containing protein [Paenibacillus artemisiicola]MBO7743498.1 TetR/AcrR family transcriptional regulator C-terminal domain-containing protein [Paenibacillus artemisiicola]
MGIPRPDRRIPKTKQHIVNAFLSLCEQRPFDAIVIKDITEAADVSRSTFYAHFQDKYDLLEQIIKAKLDELRHLYESKKTVILSYEPRQDGPDPYFAVMFEHLAENAPSYLVLLSRLPESGFEARLTEAVHGTLAQRIDDNRMDQKQPIPLDILLDSMSFWITGTAVAWLKQGMIYSPNYMAIQLSRLAAMGFYQAMNYKANK